MAFYIMNEARDLYIDASASAKGNDTPVICTRVKKGKSHQFALKENKIYSVLTGKVLDVNTETGQVILSKPAQSGSQLFFFDSDGTIRNINDKCLSLSLTKGNSVNIRDFKRGLNQKWRVVTQI